MLDRIIQKARDFADALRYASTSESPEWTESDQARWASHLTDCPECRERAARLVRRLGGGVDG